MNEHEFTLADRVQKIQSVIRQYGEDNFYISFSGGKDSTVLSELVDVALPNNRIPRVFADTGIELKLIRDFVMARAANDKRFEVIEPSTPIIQMLKQKGYPFKSKQHSKWLDNYQRKGMYWAIKNYCGDGDKKLYRSCPKILRYQFSEDFSIRVSDKCCEELKEKPISKWQRERKKKIGITGVISEEGGRRMNTVCLAFVSGKLKQFHPLALITKDWEDWFIEKYEIEICKIYKEPYNFKRTGCKGCPFALHLQKELDTLEKHFPNERKQCEAIWKPVYDEYRRIGYRLRKEECFEQVNISEVLEMKGGEQE